jgi:hypothetical protein
MKQHGPAAEDDEAAVQALRQVASRKTACSIKETFLACMLVRAVRQPRRQGHALLGGGAGVVITMIAEHWHALHSLIHFIP